MNCYDKQPATRETLWSVAAYLSRQQSIASPLEWAATAKPCGIDPAYVRTIDDWVLRRQFPPPPIRGLMHIMALDSSEDLAEEGEQQHNCVATLGWAVRMGQIYCYRVVAPQRATLALRYAGFSNWMIAELKARDNQPVRRQTLAEVRHWLRSQSRLQSPP